MSFYDQTPMGRIMNRYTADILELDLVVPFTLRSMLNTGMFDCNVIFV
jgi:hypothetical protein